MRRSFSVKRLAQSVVTPGKPSPPATLPLSVLDSYPGLRHSARILQVYRHGGHAAARTIRDALGKALVHYYPLAGRLVAADAGNQPVLHVDCNGDGSLFTEARAGCTLSDIRHLDLPYLIPLQDLVPLHQDDHFPLHLQVTRFSCGGVIVGVRMSHAMVDGAGLGQFLNAVGELARGHAHPTVRPVWFREAFYGSSKTCTSLPPTATPTARLHQFAVDIPVSYIDRVKKDCQNMMAQPCTTFEACMASVWQCRTRAIEFAADVDVTLHFTVNTRRYLSHLLPLEGGYYGNCFHTASATATSEFISKASVHEVVKLVRDAKEAVPLKLSKWRSGDSDEEPVKVEKDYEVLLASDMRRLGFNETDYGWGPPNRVVNAVDGHGIPLCILDSPVSGENSRRAMTKCVEEEHLAAFRREMMSLA